MRSTLDSSNSQKLLAFCVAVLTTSAAFATDIALGTFAAEATAALYILAAAISSFVGGCRFGLFSVALGLLPNIWLASSRHYSLALFAWGWERVVVTAIVAAVLGYVVGRLRSQRAELRSLNSELEARVRQRTAALEESNRQLEGFCYTLAHDLRAPLRAIEGFSEIVRDDERHPLSEITKANLERIRRSAEMMGRLIYDLLAHTEVQRSQIVLAETDLQLVLDRVLQILGPEISAKNASVHVKETLPNVSSDFVLLEQILLNVISNALKFARQGVQPDIQIWHEVREQHLRLCIEDNGIGIPAQHQQQIFEPFHRLHPDDYPGTGMGLAIASKAIERLGGRIGIESEINKRTCFYVELPLAAAPEAFDCRPAEIRSPPG